MAYCICGNDRFYTDEETREHVEVNAQGETVKTIEIHSNGYYSDFKCTQCGATYEDLDDLPNTMALPIKLAPGMTLEELEAEAKLENAAEAACNR